MHERETSGQDNNTVIWGGWWEGPNTKGGRGITTYTTSKCNHKNKYVGGAGGKNNKGEKKKSFALAED